MIVRIVAGIALAIFTLWIAVMVILGASAPAHAGRLFAPPVVGETQIFSKVCKTAEAPELWNQAHTTQDQQTLIQMRMKHAEQCVITDPLPYRIVTFSPPYHHADGDIGYVVGIQLVNVDDDAPIVYAVVYYTP